MNFKYIKKIGLFKDTSIYFLTNLLNSGVSFLLLPIMTRYLSPEDYGISTLFTVIMYFATVLIGFNFSAAIDRQFFNKSIDLPLYLGNCIIVSSAIFALIGTVAFVFNNWLAEVISFPENWILIAIVSSYIGLFPSILLSLLRLEQKAYLYGSFQIIQALVGVALSILLVVFLYMGWRGRLIASSLTFLLAFLISVIILIKNHKVKFRIYRPYIKDVIAFGVPLIPLSISNFAMSSADKFIISSFVGIGEMGVYSLGSQISMLVSMIISSIATAWVGWAYARLESPSREKKIVIVKATYLIFVSAIIISLLLTFIAPYMLSFIVSKSFLGAEQYIFWLSIGNAFGGMCSIVGIYILYMRKTWQASAMTIVASCIDIILTYFLVQKNGALGAAQAFGISSLILMIICWWLNSKAYDMPWLFWRAR